MTPSDTAFVPVTYTMPYARLRRLARRGTRRSYPRAWYLTWSWIGLFLAGNVLVSIFPARFDALAGELVRLLGVTIGVVETLVFGLLVGVFFAGLILIQRLFHAEHAARINFDASITLAPVQAGLHFAGAEVDYILKWSGIHELLCEPDGIVLVCGGLFFLVPDRAFATAAARNAFLDHVAAHLTPEARARSETELQRARWK